MCSITFHKAGDKVSETAITNAVYNNWHSYGLVTIVGDKLDIKKKVPESGEVDPEEILRLLHDDRDHDRYLHLRHNTAGVTDLSNTHPFDVLYSRKRHIVFMHNGTMHEYKSKKEENGKWVDDDSGPSDTKNFVDWILIPYTQATDFGNGVGDIESFRYQQMIKKFWPVGNRGLVLSAGQKPFFLGDWKTLTREGISFMASNDEYFDKVKRGPEFDRREAEAQKEKMKKQAESAFRRPSGHQLAKLEMFNLQGGKVIAERPKPGFFRLKDKVADIQHDYNLYDRPGCVSLAEMTKYELEALMGNKEACLTVMEYAFNDYKDTYKELIEAEDEIKSLKEKLHRASNLVATLKNESKNVSTQSQIG